MNATMKYERTKPPKKKKWRIFGGILALIAGSWLLIYLTPFSATSSLHKFDQNKPLVIAHGGGGHLAPSNTMAAFKHAYELGADVLEFDIHMTADGHLVVIHDPTINRTTNGTGRVSKMTLQQIQSYDAAYSFRDLNGSYSYRGKGVTVPTVDEVFATINDPDMLYNIEIKDSNEPHLYNEISEKLWNLIQDYGLEENVIIASFDQAIIEMVLEASDGKALVSGGRDEITKFVIFHKLFLNGLYRQNVHALQMPTKEGDINLADVKLIRGAQRRGMHVHYWTINDPETMKQLIDLGADGILTDRPDLLIQLLNE